MSTDKAPSDNKEPPSQPLFDPFPEPRTYPKHWDVTALESLSRPKPSKPKSTPNR